MGGMQHHGSGVQPAWVQHRAGGGTAGSVTPQAERTRFSQATAEGEQALWLRREPADASQLTRYPTQWW
jgi:hypothetical protein